MPPARADRGGNTSTATENWRNVYQQDQMVMTIKFARVIGGLVLCLVLGFTPPSWAAKLPSVEQQDLLVRSALMTFNDANATGNYSVLFAKASKQFQSSLSTDKLSEAFKTYRDQNLNLEKTIITADLLESKAAEIDDDGVLHLVGSLKDDQTSLRYDLKFIQNNAVWKLLGIDIHYKPE
jgi:hypothetical protein